MVESHVAALAAGARREAAGAGFLPFLDGVAPSSRAAADERAARDEDEHRRQRRSDDERRAGAAAQALAPPTHSQIVGEQERTLAPGSRAAARLERNAQAALDRQEHGQAFQKALQDAAAQARDRQSAAGSATPSEAASGERDSTTIQKTNAPAAEQVAIAPRTGAVKSSANGEASPSVASAARPVAESMGGAPRPQPHQLNCATQATASPVAPISRPPVDATVVAPLPSGSPVARAQATAAAAVGRAAMHPPAPAGAAGPTLDRSPAALRLRATDASTSRGAEAATRESDMNIERIVRVLQTQIDRNRSTTVIRLDPPELGMIRLRLDLRNDALSLRIESQSDVAHRLLRSELDALRSSLDAAGIHLQQVELRALSHSAAGGGEHWAPTEHRHGWQDSAGQAQQQAGGREQGGDPTAGHEPAESHARMASATPPEAELEPAADVRAAVKARRGTSAPHVNVLA
ncbi:Flagellar hook-length control protein FliK [Phycisphaerae bacterium RAS1]|nr:Flagellar hook-length control protein FliK [Phycisphaerae bacterium RAS1]